MKPSLRKTAFTTPYRSLYIQFHIWAETTVGTAQGMRTAVRTMPRPFRFAFSVSATTSPSTVSRMTETAANLTVFVTARHHRSEEHTSELQSHSDLVCRLLLE